MKKFFRRVWIAIKYVYTHPDGFWWDTLILWLCPIFLIVVPLLAPLMALSPNFIGTGTDILSFMGISMFFGLLLSAIILPLSISCEWCWIKDEFEKDDAARYAASPAGQEQARREAEERRQKEAEAYFHSLETYPFEFDHKHRLKKGSRGGSYLNDRANSLTCEFFEYCKTRYQNEEQARQKAELEAELEAERRAETERT